MEISSALLAAKRVAVIGDVMLDCYMQGRVHRVSPEAPVPVMTVTEQHATPGGAANVAVNLALLGCGVRLVGAIGEDFTAQELVAALALHRAIDLSGLVVCPARATTRKLRVIGEGQQIVRVDHEETGVIAGALERSAIDAAIDAIDACDVAILSDYAKGFLSDAVIRRSIDHARSLGKTIVVDPKRKDFSIYRGANVLTPNRAELSAATHLSCDDDASAEAAAAAARRVTDAAILLTRSERGLSYFAADRSPLHLPTVTREVFDVSGAGDTVVAAFAMGLAANLPIERGLRLANRAASIAVSRHGTAGVSLSDLIGLEVEADHPKGATIDLPSAVAWRRWCAAQKLVVGFTNGCFDLVHPGHVELLQRAADQCDRLIVGINADESVRRLKGTSRPLQSETDRARVIGAMRAVAAVIVFTEDTPIRMIEALQPDLLVKGADYQEEEIVGAELVKRLGGKVIRVELIADRSTTRLERDIARRAGPVMTDTKRPAPPPA